MKNGKSHSLNGDSVQRARLNLSQNYPTSLNIQNKLGDITKNNFISKSANERAKLHASRTKAEFRKKFLDAEIPKARSAIEEGHPYNLTDDNSPILPSTVVGWLGLSVFSVTLVGIEISTVMNSMTYALPLTQSHIRAVAMAVPLMCVPAVAKCLMPPFTRTRVALGASALTAILGFAVTFACVLGSGLENGGVLMLSLQLVAEGLGMAAISAIIATIIRRTPTERLRQIYAAYLKEQTEVEGQIAALDTLLKGIDAKETAATDEARALFEAEQAKLNIVNQQIVRLQELRDN